MTTLPAPVRLALDALALAMTATALGILLVVASHVAFRVGWWLQGWACG